MQFVVVIVVSLAVTIFFGGWAADASVEARADRLTVVGGVPSVLVSENGRTASLGSPSTHQAAATQGLEDVEKQWWESAALLVCPLH